MNAKNCFSSTLPVVVVRLFAGNLLRIIQILMYATSVSVKTAETHGDHDYGCETVRAELAELDVAADEGAERVDAVQYAAAIDIDAAVQCPCPMLPGGHQRYDGRDAEHHGSGV